MPIMEVVLQQTYFGQNTINRWNYLASGTPSAVSYSFGLVSALGAIPDTGVYPVTGLMHLIALIQASGVAFIQLGAKDVYDPIDFYETAFIPAKAGLFNGENMTPAVALGFRTNRTRTDIRRATKRFVGVTESVSAAGGVIVDAPILAAMDAVAAKMSEVLTFDDEGNTLSFAPIVVSKEEYLPNPANTENVAYRYYETEAEQLTHIMTSITWEKYTTIRTQTSRQYGRGS